MVMEHLDSWAPMDIPTGFWRYICIMFWVFDELEDDDPWRSVSVRLISDCAGTNALFSGFLEIVDDGLDFFPGSLGGGGYFKVVIIIIIMVGVASIFE